MNPLTDTVESVQRRTPPFRRRLGFVTALALFITVTTTFLILFGFAPIEPSRLVVRAALAVNTMLALVLLILIGFEVYLLLVYRKKGRAAARMHIRIVGLFSLVAAIPAILVAIVASVTLDLGLDRWFELRTKEIINSSVSVAEAYIEEHTQVHVNATVSMASNFDQARQVYSLDRTRFGELMQVQTRARGMLYSALVRKNGDVILDARRNDNIGDLPAVPQQSIDAAGNGEVIFIPRGRGKLVGAVVKLRVIPDAYLYTIRTLRDDVLASLQQMEQNNFAYRDLEQSRFPIQLTFAVLYLAVALMILLMAIWMGLSVAERFMTPIRRLIGAADSVSAGNLDVKVSTDHVEGDLRSLSQTFNVMTDELRNQRQELVQTKDDIDRRARFTEAVLSGVSASVIGVDRKGIIRIVNRTAMQELGEGMQPGKALKDAFPQISDVFGRALKQGKAELREQITVSIEGLERTLNVQVTQEQIAPERKTGKENSLVITIDDITDLVTAQRNMAWSGVARRIAHEIKNPLTPIQLSAERIRKRYSKYILEDKDVFDQCTDTIVRHVGDIGRMVDEFSSFARMPKPEMVRANLNEIVQQAVFGQRVANPQIEFVLDLSPDLSSPEGGAVFDPRLISQTMTNVLKNAVEAIEAVSGQSEAEQKRAHKGRVEIVTHIEGDRVIIDVADNGKGLPEKDRLELLEPYMTTRKKVTGLGLAIVKKIMEDHNGSIELLDGLTTGAGMRGALIRLSLPVEQSSKKPIKTVKSNKAKTTGKSRPKKGEMANINGE